jgi:hypothetical protein
MAKEDHISKAQSFENAKKTPVVAAKMKKLGAVPQWLLKIPFPKTNPFKK